MEQKLSYSSSERKNLASSVGAVVLATLLFPLDFVLLLKAFVEGPSTMEDFRERERERRDKNQKKNVARAK